VQAAKLGKDEQGALRGWGRGRVWEGGGREGVEVPGRLGVGRECVVAQLGEYEQGALR